MPSNKRILIIVFAFASLFSSHVFASNFPSICRSVGATIFSSEGLNSSDAKMSGITMFSDIESACKQGTIHQGTMTFDQCVSHLKSQEVIHQKIKASANCVTGEVNIYDQEYKLPMLQVCSSGGIHAAEAFKLLCPKVGKHFVVPLEFGNQVKSPLANAERVATEQITANDNRANLLSVTTLKGNCSSLIVANKDRPCTNSVINTEYDSGRIGFYFLDEISNSALTFSGMGQKQQYLSENSRLQPIDGIIIARKPHDAIGSCKFENPFNGPAHIECIAKLKNGEVFSAVFLSDGSEPKINQVNSPAQIRQSTDNSQCIDEYNNLNVTNEVENVLNWVKRLKRNAYEVQRLLKQYGVYGGRVDGEFGKNSSKALCKVMQTYIAIGGTGIEWGINNVSDAPKFVDWLFDAAEANETGGEFPD